MNTTQSHRLEQFQQNTEDNESNMSIGLSSNHYVIKIDCQRRREVIDTIELIVTLLERLNTEHADQVFTEDIRMWITPNESRNSEDSIPVWFAYPTNDANRTACNDIIREDFGTDPMPFNTDKFENRLFWCGRSTGIRYPQCNCPAHIHNNHTSIF